MAEAFQLTDLEKEWTVQSVLADGGPLEDHAWTAALAKAVVQGRITYELGARIALTAREVQQYLETVVEEDN